MAEKKQAAPAVASAEELALLDKIIGFFTKDKDF